MFPGDKDWRDLGPGSSVGLLTSPGEGINVVNTQWILLTRRPAHMDILMSLLGFVTDTWNGRERMIGRHCPRDREESCTWPEGQLVQLDYKPFNSINQSLRTLGWLAGTEKGEKEREGERMCRKDMTGTAALWQVHITLAWHWPSFASRYRPILVRVGLPDIFSVPRRLTKDIHLPPWNLFW